jgi:phage terminase large subunit
VIELPAKLERLFEPYRFKFLKGGRGSAKSWSVARIFLILGTMGVERILCTREVQKSIKQSVHQLLRDQIPALGLGWFYEVQATEIRGRNGTRFFFAGLSDQTVDSIKSFEGCTRVWNEEGQTTTRRSWQILIPTIRVDGSEIWTTYNPELETDETHVMAMTPDEDTLTIEMNYGDNPWFPEVLEKARAKAERTMVPAEYAHIWLGRCMPAVKGAIYFDEIAAAEAAGRIGRFPYDPMLKVHRIWDMGWNDAMAIILAQRSGSAITVIGYVTGSHRTVASYLADFRGPDYRGWNWGKDFLPHDGFAKNRQTGKADSDVLEGLGCEVMRTTSVELEQGIRRARDVFPRVYINEAGCASTDDELPGLVDCLKRYRRRINQRTDTPEGPLHDVHSNGADAFRYLAINVEEMTNEDAKPLDLPVDDDVGGSWMST